jgi:hypothetical protein
MSSGMSMMYGLSAKYIRLSTNARQTSAVQPPAIAGTPKPGCSTCAGKQRRRVPPAPHLPTPAPAPAPAPEPIVLMMSAAEPIPPESFTEDSFQTPFIHPEDDTYFHQPLSLDYSMKNVFHNIFQEIVWNTPEDFSQITLSFDSIQMIQQPFSSNQPLTLPHSTLELFIRETLQSFGWNITTKAYISGVTKPLFTPTTSPMAILLRNNEELWLLTYDTETHIWRYHGTEESPLIINPNIYLESLDSSVLAIYLYDSPTE